jgi:hypothetical protein
MSPGPDQEGELPSVTDRPGDLTVPTADTVAPVTPLHAVLADPAAFERRAEELRRWRHGFPDRSRPLASLLDALVAFFKLPTQTADLESNATSRRPMADVMEEERRLVDEELAKAGEARPSFELGMRLARTAIAAGATGSELSLESRDPEQDRVAGALIGYLVSTDFATVRTEELPGGQYRYNIAVDWRGLDDFATRLGLPAPSQLA